MKKRTVDVAQQSHAKRFGRKALSTTVVPNHVPIKCVSLRFYGSIILTDMISESSKLQIYYFLIKINRFPGVQTAKCKRIREE